VLHEFGVIEGVKEDVQDICLNLKDLLLQVHSDEPVMLRLDKRGEVRHRGGPLDDGRRGDLERRPSPRVPDQRQERVDLRAHRRAWQGYVGAEGNKVLPRSASFPWTRSSPGASVSFEIERFASSSPRTSTDW